MIAYSDELKTLFAKRVFKMALLFTLTLKNGIVMRYTSYDRFLIWDSNRFLSGGLLFDAGGFQWKNDLSVDSVSLKISASEGYLIQGKTFQSALRSGLFDGASVRIDRAYMEASGKPDVVGVINRFIGTIGDIDPVDRLTAQVTIDSILALLNVNMPRNIYELKCGNMLYDNNCGLDKADFTTTNTIETGATLTNIPVLNSSPDNYYQYGVIIFTSGVNQGLSFPIKRYIGDCVYLSMSMPAIPSAGDTINLIAGCDKTWAMCSGSKFNNQNFRGFPFIPVAETAL